jgi:hypothetical protein
MLPLRRCVAVLAVLAAAGQANAEEAPLLGCYERGYDAAHLTAHEGQIIVRATLEVMPRKPEMASSGAVAIGDLRLWTRGRSESFQSYGTCYADGGALTCTGSSSAYEADACAARGDGVTVGCRRPGYEDGKFRVEERQESVLVSIEKPIELSGLITDSDFLYLSPGNAENAQFLLRRREKCD